MAVQRNIILLYLYREADAIMHSVALVGLRQLALLFSFEVLASIDEIPDHHS
jgi:hypothetical protein